MGKQLDLFHLQDEAPGMVFWHPKGWALWQTIEQHMRKELNAAGYKEVKTPQIMDKTFWEKSGHWDNYKDNMFDIEIPSLIQEFIFELAYSDRRASCRERV